MSLGLAALLTVVLVGDCPFGPRALLPFLLSGHNIAAESFEEYLVAGVPMTAVRGVELVAGRRHGSVGAMRRL